MSLNALASAAQSKGIAVLSGGPAALALVCSLAGANLLCDDSPAGTDRAVAPQIGVSIAPQKFIVDAITGGSVPVAVLIPTGADPHMYEPGPEQLRRLSRLRVFFAQGLEFEQVCLDRMRDLNSELEVIAHRHSSADLTLPAAPGADESGHEHGHEHGHNHNPQTTRYADHNEHNHNPHTWLSPRLVRAESQTVLATLIRLLPEQASSFRAGHRELLREIDRVDRYIQMQLTPVRGRLLLVYHPSWEYFARDYGLRLLAVHADGHAPSPRALMRLARISRAENVRTIFAEPGFDRRAVEMLARDLDADVATINPLAGDWGPNLCRTADRIAGALAP